MEFRRANEKDLGGLTALWALCFGDEPREIKAFWKALFDKISVYVAAEKTEIQAMLCALPVSFVDEEGESHPAVYFYAVATAPSHRRQGLCHRLMAYAQEAEAKMGAEYCFLCPASRPLIDFYREMGYTFCLFRDRYSTPVEKYPVKITKITPEAYQNLRLMQIYGSFVDYGTELLSWQDTLGRATGAGLYRIEGEDFVCCAAAEKQGQRLNIKELLPNEPQAAASLAAYLGCQEVQACVPGAAELFALGKSLRGGSIPQDCCFALGFEG